MMNPFNENQDAKIISFCIKYFEIYSKPDKQFVGIAGTNGSYMAYKTKTKELSGIIYKHIKTMDRGLNVIIDNTDYFLLTSLKRSLNIFNKSNYYTGKITFENGCLRKIINDKYDIKR